jgi:hypothetical protein
MSTRLAIIVVLVAVVGILAIIGWRAPERPHLPPEGEDLDDA